MLIYHHAPFNRRDRPLWRPLPWLTPGCAPPHGRWSSPFGSAAVCLGRADWLLLLQRPFWDFGVSKPNFIEAVAGLPVSVEARRAARCGLSSGGRWRWRWRLLAAYTRTRSAHVHTTHNTQHTNRHSFAIHVYRLSPQRPYSTAKPRYVCPIRML
jgi:hypothetical protein